MEVNRLVPSDWKQLTTAYLACPYASDFREEAIFRHQMASMVAAKLMAEHHYSVFSPISQSEALLDFIPDDLNIYDFWIERDLAMVTRCQELIVLPMLGYKSRGVVREVILAHDLQIPIKFVIMKASFIVPFEELEKDEFYQIYSKGTIVIN